MVKTRFCSTWDISSYPSHWYGPLLGNVPGRGGCVLVVCCGYGETFFKKEGEQMNELLIAIALWCGEPSYGHATPPDVTVCRQHLLDCVYAVNVTGDVAKKCFEKEKVK